jgi:hypothetical protein
VGEEERRKTIDIGGEKKKKEENILYLQKSQHLRAIRVFKL